MKLASLLLFIGFAVSAQAESRFETLQNWFTGGEPVKFEDVRGFYSGRCYSWTSKNVPRPALLGYQERSHGANQGPGFPEQKELRMISLSQRGVPADRFDGIQDYDLLIGDFMVFNWPRLFQPEDEPTLHWTMDWEQNGRADIQSEYVRHEEFIVEKTTALIRQTYADFWTGRRARFSPGDILTMCYYFEKLD